MKDIDDIELENRLVFLRIDYNVPLTENGEIRDDTKIRASLTTVQALLQKGARIVLASHMGRPKGKFDPKLSLRPVAKRLGELVPNKIVLAPDVVGAEVDRLKKDLKKGEILVLENLRFYKEETDNDDAFARRLAEGVDVYINDAFASCHRAHASVVAITRHIPVKAAGYLLRKEVDNLGKALHNPAKPYVAILGGSKVEDKIPVIENLINKADIILIGGAMAYTFLKAQGHDVGKSLVEDDKLDISRTILKKAEEKGVRIVLPQDHVTAATIDASAKTVICDTFSFPVDMMGVDIGPKTVEAYAKIIATAKTIVWNGPLGVYEIDTFAKGTNLVAKAVAESSAMSIIGGGDSIAAVKKAGMLDKITHISTGGGASLEFLAYETLPGIQALEG